MGLETLLVVDDDEVLLRSFQHAARAWCVVTATDIARGFELARTERPAAAIVDLCLGSEWGVDLVVALRRRDPAMVIVVLTGFNSAAAGWEAAKAGADRVVEKGIDVQEALEHVAAIRVLPRALTLNARIDAYVVETLEACDGNKSEAARRLGIHRYSMQRKAAKLISSGNR